MKKRILLAEDHSLMREGLRTLLEQKEGFEVVGEAGDGERAVELALSLKPDVILMDIRMPKKSGIEATRSILLKLPETKVLGLSMHEDQEYVTEMLKAGGVGYILKDSPAAKLVEAIEAVMAGGRYLDRKAADLLARSYSAAETADEASAFLTPREREVAGLIAEGFTIREIADRLSLSIHTVHTYRKRVMTKLDLTTDADITRYAIRKGLISP